MTVRIVTPDNLLFEGAANRVLAEGLDGKFTILLNHAPALIPLGIGELKVVDEEKNELYFAIDTGILEVLNNQVNILSNDAMMAGERGIAMAKMELERVKRKKQNIKVREQLIKSEMELHLLFHQGQDQ